MANTTDDSSFAFLTQLLPHLDRHLIYPLLEHESNAEDIPAERYSDLRLAIFNLLKNTNMTDFVADLYKDTYNGQSPPAEFEKKRSSVLTTLQKYEEDSSHILDVLEDQDITTQLRSDKIANLKFLADERQVTQAEVDLLYTFGRFRYECGQY
ncbi:eukaryotic translation initiation factor 3 subunit E, partial [Elasticomyces elasticus]